MNINTALRKLSAMKGKFFIDDLGSIRHRRRLVSKYRYHRGTRIKLCPLNAICPKPIEGNEVESIARQLDMDSEEADLFASAADIRRDSDEGEVYKLRRRILRAVGLKEKP